MPDEVVRRVTRWRSALVPAATAVLAVACLLIACSSPEPRGGAPTPEDVVTAYVSALNAKDAAALRALSLDKDPELGEAVDRRLADYGGRDVRLTSQDVQSPVPHQAAAHLEGTLTGASGQREPYGERLLLDRADGRWYLKVVESGPPSTGGALPTAATGSASR